jgi:hypothetical protein
MNIILFLRFRTSFFKFVSPNYRTTQEQLSLNDDDDDATDTASAAVTKLLLLLQQILLLLIIINKTKQTPWPDSANELYRPSDHRSSEKLVPTFEDSWCQVFSVTDPYDRFLDFLDRSRYFFFQVAPQL